MNHKEYIREPEGAKTAVVMIHGIIGTPDHFDMFVPMIPEDWAIYNVLLDGHGKGVGEFASSSMEKWKTQVRYIMKELRLRYDSIYLVGHSMGTLLSIQETVTDSSKIKGLFLMAVPLRAGIKLKAPKNALKVIFGKISEDDLWAAATKRACSIALDVRLWLYLTWIPRYVELLEEMYKTRGMISEIQVPCYVFQSGKDELVSKRSVEYLRVNGNLKKYLLKNSGHFYYEKNDEKKLKKAFRKFLKSTEKEE